MSKSRPKGMPLLHWQVSGMRRAPCGKVAYRNEERAAYWAAQHTELRRPYPCDQEQCVPLGLWHLAKKKPGRSQKQRRRQRAMQDIVNLWESEGGFIPDAHA